ncbi:MAG: hypothetical protein DRG78_03330 [Epsilonproteobacteria bacterium]|nr:MAG: hypothetical protein DRG78_03330 [Campylobacterota bacterium]
MIDKWFKKDLDKIFDKHNIVVIMDESKKSKFLLDTLTNFTIYEAHNEIDELKVKYEIEKTKTEDSKYIIYTQTPKDKLKYIREYCETNGSVSIKLLQNYIKEKLFENLKLNLTLSEDKLISAAKVSIGKDEIYWRGLESGTSEIFDLEKELLPFLHRPDSFINKYDTHTKEQFFKTINKYLKQDNINKPAKTIANEVVFRIFDSLATNNTDKLGLIIYKNWLDSLEYKKSFDKYLKNYKLMENYDIWNIHPSHPFKQIDLAWLKQIGENISNKEKLINFKAKINQRVQNKEAKSLEIIFWKDVKVLLDFDLNDMNKLSSMDECIDFYTKHLYKVDQSIRAFYTEFLDKNDLLEPFQEYYKNILSIFLEKWFKYFDQYKQNQIGILKSIIESNDCKTAIIVGDGVTYETSQNIADLVSPEYNYEDNIILADTPSITENNMSQIYVSSGKVFEQLANREKFLKDEMSDKDIGFVHLDKINENTSYQYLISQYGDIDTLGDKMNNAALKYFPESEKTFASKIEFLLNNGYKKVYLITDHGFVLTGQLNEYDKIDVDFNGKIKKNERYIRTQDQQTISNQLIEKEQKHNEYNYVYFAKSMNPFKTVGAYGFSHGGLSPQELITPYLCWSNDSIDSNSLKAIIKNKKDLENVTGELFQIRLEINSATNDLFSNERQIYIVLFSNGTQISKSEIIYVSNNDKINKEYSFDGHAKIDIKVLDAITKEQLDYTTAKQNKDRDMGGLF